MASQVLNGSSNVTYTNTTGGNVRVIINYMAGSGPNSSLNITWMGVTASANYVKAIGRNLAYIGGVSQASTKNISLIANNMMSNDLLPASTGIVENAEVYNQALPTEIMLANGQSFSATCGVYNIVVIPEAG